MLLDPGMNLTLRPMAYPKFYEMYKDAIRNTWTVDEVDFSTDTGDLRYRMTDADRHLIQRLVAFFATGDSIVANNLVLNLYKHINAPEARMYLSRQLYEEALHVQFYLTLLDTYVPEPSQRAKAFAAVEKIPSIRAKADFCLKWIDSIQNLQRLETQADRKQFLLNLICFAGVHRRALLLRRVCLRLLPALARSVARTGRRHQLGLPRRERAHGVRVRGGQDRAPRGARPLRRRAESGGGDDDATRPSTARCSSPRTS